MIRKATIASVALTLILSAGLAHANSEQTRHEIVTMSPLDRQVWVGVYRSLFNFDSTLSKYALGANPSIRIGVANGRVTLSGVVSNAMDKQLAAMAANRVFGVFSVDNELQIESRS
jgi:hypothetical protein